MEEVEFRPFSHRGSFWSFDGEVLVKKGLARARCQTRSPNFYTYL
jgi:hypothetical protein